MMADRPAIAPEWTSQRGAEHTRVAHAVIHISGFGRFRARTVLFSVAWIAFIVFAVVVLEHAR